MSLPFATLSQAHHVTAVQRTTCSRNSFQGAYKRLSSTTFFPVLISRGRLHKMTALGDGGDKTGIRREDEPEEYWTSKGERSGESPLKDPIALIGILAILFPFIFLLIAIAFGWVDTSGGR